MSSIYIILIILSVFCLAMGIYIGVIQNKYLKIKFNSISDESINVALSNNSSEPTKRVEKICDDKVMSDFNKPVIIKSILIEDSIDTNDNKEF